MWEILDRNDFQPFRRVKADNMSSKSKLSFCLREALLCNNGILHESKNNNKKIKIQCNSSKDWAHLKWPFKCLYSISVFILQINHYLFSVPEMKRYKTWNEKQAQSCLFQVCGRKSTLEILRNCKSKIPEKKAKICIVFMSCSDRHLWKISQSHEYIIVMTV